jgi:hypothetical protein
MLKSLQNQSSFPWLAMEYSPFKAGWDEPDMILISSQNPQIIHGPLKGPIQKEPFRRPGRRTKEKRDHPFFL